MTTSATGREEVATTTPSSVSRDSSEAVGYPWLRASSRRTSVIRGSVQSTQQAETDPSD